MKKFVAGATGALLLSAGLVASTGTAAHADYPGSVATTTSVNAPAKVTRKKKAKICASVTAAGNIVPTGTVTITVSRNAGRFTQSETFNYSGGQVCMITRKLKKIGGYVARAEYDAKAGTPFNDSANSAGFDVVKKRRR